MVDIASLGLKIDSSDTVKATGALDAFAAASKPAAAGASAVEKATTSAAAGTGALGKAAAASAKGTEALTTGSGLARHELINLSRQAQDVVVSLQGGQGLGTVLLQQGSQIADVFVSSKGSVGGFANQIISAIGPVRLLAGGITLVAGAALYMVNSLKNSALAADDLSRSAGLSITQLRGLQTALSFKGISGDDATKFIQNFGQGVYQARINAGGLSEVFRANNISAKGFSDYMAKAADLIRNAKDDQQRLALLQEMGLPANMQFVRFMQQGGDAIKKAAAEAENFNNTAEGKLVASARAFDDAWNRGVTNVSNRMKTWALNAYEWLDNIVSKAAAAAVALNNGTYGVAQPKRVILEGFNGTNDPAAKVKTTAERQKEITDRQTYLGLLGQTTTAEQAAEQVRLANDAAFLSSGVSVGKQKLLQLQQLAREQSNGTTAIKASTDAANVDAATIGMAVGPANAYAAAQNAINEAKRSGRTLSASDLASINANAAALGAAAQNADNLRTAYEGLVRGPLQTFQQQIAQGSKFFDALKASGVSALNAVSSKLMDMAAQNLWTSAFGGSTGGAGSFFSSLFGSGGSGASAQAASASTLANGTGGAFYGPGFASGTNSAPGGLARINEQGGEIVNLPNGTQVIPHDVSMAMAGRVAAPAANDNASAQAVHVTVGVTVDQSGNLQAYVKDVAQQTTASGIGRFVKSPAFVDNVGAAARKASGRRL